MNWQIKGFHSEWDTTIRSLPELKKNQTHKSDNQPPSPGAHCVWAGPCSRWRFLVTTSLSNMKTQSSPGPQTPDCRGAKNYTVLEGKTRAWEDYNMASSGAEVCTWKHSTTRKLMSIINKRMFEISQCKSHISIFGSVGECSCVCIRFTLTFIHTNWKVQHYPHHQPQDAGLIEANIPLN